ncbi:PREDICTED: zinc finger CCCH-type antiviral protein 1-like [Condylura cristata]|uniref:zinc finger CCCH-type antiviral protein 1-like n=1 Tax=Condylura cristata TaxID=143302 RepID=UPI000334655F|nr:PREDICTED: zinc finger CCCH-type antiviral protein 1-like [Condylura cristata]
MAEPTVCSFLTKVLCAHGGRMFLQDLRANVELSEARLRDVLRQAGPDRFLLSTCTLSHDIHTPVNIQVLKNHGLFGLNEAQLRTLLLQNDPCLLPEVCLLYNKGEALYGYCNLKDKCNKFHVCKSFVRGECRLQKCKRSHQLIHATALQLLQDQGLNIPSVVHFQIISTYRHMKLHGMLEDKGNSASAGEQSQGLETQGTHGAGVPAQTPQKVPGPAQSPKKAGAALLSFRPSSPCAFIPRRSSVAHSRHVCGVYAGGAGTALVRHDGRLSTS